MRVWCICVPSRRACMQVERKVGSVQPLLSPHYRYRKRIIRRVSCLVWNQWCRQQTPTTDSSESTWPREPASPKTDGCHNDDPIGLDLETEISWLNPIGYWQNTKVLNSIHSSYFRGMTVTSGVVTIKKDESNLIGISIGGGAPLCPCLYVVQVRVLQCVTLKHKKNFQKKELVLMKWK